MAAPRGDVCRVIVLGSTGSIGTQTLEVIEHLDALHARGAWPRRYEVVGLAARNPEAVLNQACAFAGVHCAIGGGVDPELLKALLLRLGVRSLRIRCGPGAPEELVRSVDCDLVVAAMSGAAGLPATLA